MLSFPGSNAAERGPLSDEAGTLGASAAPEGRIEDHRICLLYDFPCLQTDDLGTLRGLSAAIVDPDDHLALVHRDRRSREDALKPLLEEKPFPLGDDLHPAVAAALGGHIEDWRAGGAITCLRLTDRGRAILNGDWVRPPGDPRALPGYLPRRGLAVLLGTESRRRLAAARRGDHAADGAEIGEHLPVTVTDLRLLTFPSRVGLAILELAIGSRALGVAELQEVLHVASHGSRAGSIGWQCLADPAPGFTLPELVIGLLRPAGCAPEPWNRIYSYVFARFAAFPTQPCPIEETAWRLSRRYTSDYHPGTDYREGMALLRPFEDVVHAAGIEGAVTLSAGSQPFLVQAMRDRVAKCYLPLAILAYHEHVQLIEMAQQAVHREGAAERVSTDRLGGLLDRFLTFRLLYRLPVASDITMHNLFYDALRRGLELERLTRKIVEDVAEAERSLRRNAIEAEHDRAARHERDQLARERAYQRSYFARERRRAPLLGLFAAMLTFLTCFAAFREVREVLLSSAVGRYLPEGGPLVLATVFGLLSWWVTWRRHRDEFRQPSLEHEHSHPVDHTGEHLDAERQQEGVNTATALLAAAAGAATLAKGIAELN